MTLGNDNGTDGQTDRRTDRVRRNMRPPPREEGRITTSPKRLQMSNMATSNNPRNLHPKTETFGGIWVDSFGKFRNENKMYCKSRSRWSELALANFLSMFKRA